MHMGDQQIAPSCLYEDPLLTLWAQIQTLSTFPVDPLVTQTNLKLSASLMSNTSGHIFSAQAVSAVARGFFDTHSNPISTRREPQQDSELPKASKRKATPRIDLDAHYKRQETNKERGRLLTLASLGASSTDRQRAAARVVDTTHIIKRGIIRKPRDHTPPLERYKPRKGRLTTGGRKPAPPPELITSNAVPPPVIAPIPTRPLPNFIKTNTIARPIRPLPSRVRPTIHIETLTKQDEHQGPIFSLATELDKVCADLHTGTCTYTFVEKQVINKVCLEIGGISFKQIGKEERLQEIAKALVFISKPIVRTHPRSSNEWMTFFIQTSRPQDSASQVGGPASPTPSLVPAYVPPIWEFEGHQFEHLEDALRQSAPGEVPDHIREWVIVAMKLTVTTEIAKVYNVLGNKITG
ncbi:uncharacterized protein LAESUDRAFT_765044 [Laetiporus sulphureus 93-53]|uniref:Uncharacterized protein n=1 Tax=Laetiporus sulphureus 93-53 TaxID=1314785 RepID=A0A165B081_9APHY|nr:uncharacterized protein LAESUDRAFT_765044 [Laetiporus sulphureus 93-53]KZS99982.1 hypothetical protein LAESUDRAFT_765044 [Laetiporus sulphureus 93-53]